MAGTGLASWPVENLGLTSPLATPFSSDFCCAVSRPRQGPSRVAVGVSPRSQAPKDQPSPKRGDVAVSCDLKTVCIPPSPFQGLGCSGFHHSVGLRPRLHAQAPAGAIQRARKPGCPPPYVKAKFSTPHAWAALAAKNETENPSWRCHPQRTCQPVRSRRHGSQVPCVCVRLRQSIGFLRRSER